jgi:DNA-directed RNA polymerase specialized sigma24 family protein
MEVKEDSSSSFILFFPPLITSILNFNFYQWVNTDIDCEEAIHPEKLLASFLTLISRTMRWACRCYHRFPDQGVMDDLTQEIALLLIRNDYRNLRSFKHRSVEKTWLQILVLHHVARYFKNQKLTEPLENLPLNSLLEPPLQEKRVLFNERKRLVENARSKLSEREQELWDLLAAGWVMRRLQSGWVSRPGQFKGRNMPLLRKSDCSWNAGADNDLEGF